MKQEIRTDAAPPPGPYSQAVRVGDFVFLSGQIALDPATKEVVGTTVAEQAARVMDNLKAVVEADGATMDDVVKTTCYLTDMTQFASFNEVYASYFTDPKPARATVRADLMNDQLLVEVDAIVHKPMEG